MHIPYVPAILSFLTIIYNTASFYSYTSSILAKDVPSEVYGQQGGTKFEERHVLGKST